MIAAAAPVELTQGSDPVYAKRLAGEGNKEISAFYNQDISDKLTPKTRQILEEYSQIPTARVIRHIHEVRDKAWAIRAYPCIGSGIYLDPILPKQPSYPTVLSRLINEDAVLLEVGSFLGSDLRSVVADGAPSSNLIATDVVSFWDIGYEMFQDKDRFKCRFYQADLMDPNGALQKFQHSIDIIHISKVLHQWSFDRQVEACEHLVGLSREGTMIVGDQMGGETAHELIPYPDLPGLWMHDENSWREMWEIISKKTDTQWDTQTTVRTIAEMEWDPKDYTYLREDRIVLMFTMTRTK
ncbi:hypothetical protein BO70DRAFT_364781 [Aspergillus heteromorphus CBS 117.55]|uniref:Methyltransferase domain-containing protein n=1 Tax=Aspergillus heteromorphus CBS 117.55 TaxID=1448321 RepID=A0A317VHU5_9EURO|nr:uncharacterized protein BO70DRAFT_364781 [Aspergillus heteromorphus CBS 117.55]PWY73029.1 hypothetical protein BO70DRAFT_364781 [Aspergillus heteromorphus CBS 117.55]